MIYAHRLQSSWWNSCCARGRTLSPTIHKARSIKAIADAEFVSSALEAVTDAEALIIATDWNEFCNVDLTVLKEKMRTPIVFDGRNLLDPQTMRQFGFHYYSIGRARVKPQ